MVNLLGTSIPVNIKTIEIENLGSNKCYLHHLHQLIVPKSVFNDDLCRTLILSVITLFKLKNSALNDFIPDESTLQKKYVNGA